MNTVLAVARVGIGIAAVSLAIFMLATTALAQRKVALNQYRLGYDYIRHTWWLYAGLAAGLVPFAIYVIAGGHNPVIITVVMTAVVTACGGAAFIKRAECRYYAHALTGVATTFFAFGALLIGGPLWIQWVAVGIALLGLALVVYAFCAPLESKELRRA